MARSETHTYLNEPDISRCGQDKSYISVFVVVLGLQKRRRPINRQSQGSTKPKTKWEEELPSSVGDTKSVRAAADVLIAALIVTHFKIGRIKQTKHVTSMRYTMAGLTQC